MRDALGLGRRKLAPPFIVTLEHLQGMIDNKALVVAVELELELEIPDHLHGGPRRATDLAADVGADADALNRLLRFLVSRGLLGMTRDGCYRTTRCPTRSGATIRGRRVTGCCSSVATGTGGCGTRRSTRS
jgi:hypothetical protein